MALAIAIPMPLDLLGLPAELDGSAGENRAAGGNQPISAQTDTDALKVFLAQYIQSKTTFENYRKEVERFYLWSAFQLGKPLSSLRHEDLLAYQQFLTDPQPTERWVCATRRKPPRGHPDWRPFQGPLSAQSCRQAAVILNVMFSWLVNAGYLAGNPLALTRQRQRPARPRSARYLEDDLWLEAKHFILRMPHASQRERAHFHRTRWLFTLLYLGGLRISEVAENSMGSFFCRRDRAGEERWWLEVLGKSRTTRLVPATKEMITELSRYRRDSGLTPLPSPGEDTPLVLPIGRVKRPLTRAALHSIVKNVFEKAAAGLRIRGEEFAGRADQLAKASAHWLRHTAGSHMANQDIDLRNVRENLGHKSLRTTSQYLYTEDDQRHKETAAKHRIDW
jgi:site-specific recombinase XerD